MFLQSVSTAAMEKALSATWQKKQLIDTNLANEDTPGYKAKRLHFEALLQNEMDNMSRSRSLSRRDGVERIAGVTPRVYQQIGTMARADGNNVDKLAEQTELARVQLQYQALAQKVSGYYSTLKYAISGGR